MCMFVFVSVYTLESAPMSNSTCACNNDDTDEKDDNDLHHHVRR